MPSTGPRPRTSGRRKRFEHRDLKAAHAARGRHLGPDEPGADTTTRGPASRRARRSSASIDGAQHEDPVERRACSAACAGWRRSRAAHRRTASVPSSSRVRMRPAASSAVARTPRRRSRSSRRTACVATRDPGAPTHPPAAASTAAGGRTAGAARHRRARSGRRTPPGAASPWPAALRVRPPPPPRFATPLLLSSGCSPRAGHPCPGGPGHERASTLVQGGRTRVDATAHYRLTGTGPRTRALVQVESTFEV